MRPLGIMSGLQRGEQVAAEASDSGDVVCEGAEVLVACVGVASRRESATLGTRSELPLAKADAAIPRPSGIFGKRKSLAEVFLGAVSPAMPQRAAKAVPLA